jgi:predicted permease
MRALRIIASRVRGLLASARSDRELAAELESHLAFQVDENLRAGMPPAEARRRALAKLGSATAATQVYREQRGVPRLESWWQDARYAVRGSRRNPGFAAACIATLALGIGANSAIFSVVNGVLFAPLPYAKPGQLISIWTRHPEVSRDPGAMSAENALDLRRMLTTVSGLEVLQATVVPSSLIVNGNIVPAQRVAMTPGMFSLLGRPALHGRSLQAGDGPGVAVVSHAFWRRVFGGDPSVVGRAFGEGDRALTIVGVMPPDFMFPYASILRATMSFTSSSDVDFWVALPEKGGADVTRATRLFAVVARMNDGVSVDEARADAAVAWSQLAQSYPDVNRGWEAVVVPLHDQAVAPVRSTMLLLFGGVGVVLLIACVNVANLLLARGVARRRELGLRAALGAGRARLVQQVMVESLVLSLMGAAVGLLVARSLVPLLVSWAPPNTPRLAEIALDWRVVIFAAIVSMFCGLVVGLVPALGASRATVRDAAGDGGRGATTGRRRLRGILVAAEVGLAVVLSVGAGLLARSFISVLNVDPGFRSDRLLTMALSVPGQYNTNEKRIEFYRRLFARLESVPGITSVGGTTRLPLGGANSRTQVAVEGRIPPEGEWPEADFRRAVHDYFTTMGIPVRRGRAFDAGDRAEAPPVAMINEALARQMFGDGDPIGRQIRLGPSSPVRQATVIGIVGDLRHQRLDMAPAPEVYVHYLQAVPVAPLIVMRTAGDAAALAGAVRAATGEVDRSARLYNIRTMTDLRATTMLGRRFLTGLVLAFGLLAIALAAVGVYGVMALVVAERTREMGIRLALGAPPSGLMTLVMRQAIALAAIGGAAGLIAALALAPLLASQLYGIGARDPITMGLVPALLLAVAVAAAVLPARRVTRIDPVATLRSV